MHHRHHYGKTANGVILANTNRPNMPVAATEARDRPLPNTDASIPAMQQIAPVKQIALTNAV
jgi:hypothetical protein